MLIGLGLAALVIVWLVFSLLRRVFGLVLLVGLAVGGWIWWSNPDLFQDGIDAVKRLFGAL